MAARPADEGRSAFTQPRRFDERITLFSDPSDRDNPASPIGEDGLPQRKITWIEKGELRNLHRSRFWAQKTGKEAIPNPSSLHLAGTDASVQDLVSGVDRAVLVTRFWYNRLLEPRTVMVTGLTRDGTFMVEQGKITKALRNFRFNESPLTLLSKVVAIGRPERVSTRGGLVLVVPPLVVEGFNFASRSDAI
jgi:predicted Zn-dependent protease